jgi:hypothetical protein
MIHLRFTWRTKQFLTATDKDNFIRSNKKKFEIAEIYIGQGYCIEYRELI